MSKNNDVTIGLVAQGSPAFIKNTLDSIHKNTNYPFKLIIIDDATEIQTQRYLNSIDVEKISISYSKGMAFCANMLIENSNTPYLVFLQSGTYVTSGWLSGLLDILKNKPNHGIVGPSTCDMWNQQKVIDKPNWSNKEIESFANKLQKKHDTDIQYLNELHSIGEFCYCFKREIINKIGYFDEEYGLGPCHEIDFSTRAAKVNYKSVWAKGVYVHRFPRPKTLEHRELIHFDRSKKIYQKKFCGIKLGQDGGCETNFEHCLGESCEFFSPQKLIQTFVEKPLRKSIMDKTKPLVSCIMPTQNRQSFVSQAIKYFLHQDYPNKELIILDKGHDDTQKQIPCNNNIKYIKLDENISLGEARNMAISNSLGEIIIHWDDDDWYGCNRITRQIEPIIKEECDLTGIEGNLLYDISEQQFWNIDSELHVQIMANDILGGSIAYRKKIWEEIAKFYSVNIAEDAMFIQDVFNSGASLLKIPNRGDYIYVRHDTNTWKFNCGEHVNSKLWQKIDPPEFISTDDLNFYKQIVA